MEDSETPAIVSGQKGTGSSSKQRQPDLFDMMGVPERRPKPKPFPVSLPEHQKVLTASEANDDFVNAKIASEDWSIIFNEHKGKIREGVRAS